MARSSLARDRRDLHHDDGAVVEVNGRDLGTHDRLQVRTLSSYLGFHDARLANPAHREVRCLHL